MENLLGIVQSHPTMRVRDAIREAQRLLNEFRTAYIRHRETAFDLSAQAHQNEILFDRTVEACSNWGISAADMARVMNRCL